MYQHRITPFGDYEKHELFSTAGGNRLALVPGFGACVLGLQLQGQSVLDGYQDPLEMNINRWAKNVLLFPFPNRLKQGRYEWEGQTYEFPINDGQTGNALHGFGMDKPMEVASVHRSAEQASISCVYRHAGRDGAFPFPFTFEAEFSLMGQASAAIHLRVRNEGPAAMPFGMGWHPYFRLADTADELSLELPACELIGLGSDMIPTGKRYPYDDFARLRPLGAAVLDNCFALVQQSGRAELLLVGSRGRLRYWQQAGPGKFPFVQIFTPPHRQSLAIEPMSCNIDAFNNGQGLLRLEPGQAAEADFGFDFYPAEG